MPSSASSSSHSSKPQSSCQKLFISCVLLLSFSLVLLVFTIKPRPLLYTVDSPAGRVLQRVNNNDDDELDGLSLVATERWFDLIEEKLRNNSKKIKVGLVNIDDNYDNYNVHGLVQAVHVKFEPLTNKDLQWEKLFPEWIDEDEKWGPPKCPVVPMPRLEDYRDLDVVMAKLPCGSDAYNNSMGGIRDVFRLQVNLVVANLVVARGRTVYVLFVGSRGAMPELFRCDDLVTHAGDYWLYKPELRRLKQKVQMPVGSCEIAPALAETGKEVWRSFMSQTKPEILSLATHNQRAAYATVLHSSEAYVCGAIALARSIRQSNSSKDLVLLHDSSIGPRSLRGLAAAGWKTRLIQPIRSPFAKKGSYNEWNYSKLRIWQLEDYDKVIFVDADILVLRNIDNFFLYPELSASSNSKLLFNSGIMVIEPSECMFQDMMTKSSELVPYNGGDQGFVNEVFTWWHRLPSRLNRLKVFVNKEKNKDHEVADDVYAIHFLGLKPWMCYRDYDCNWDMSDRHIFASDSAHRRFWPIYDAMPQELQQYCGLSKQMDARIRKWRGIAKKASLPDRHWKIPVHDPRRHRLV